MEMAESLEAQAQCSSSMSELTLESEDPQETAGAANPAPRTMRDLVNPMMKHSLEHLSVGADERKDWKGQSLMIYGPQCWKCFGWCTWWKCQSCERSYHKKCAFFGEQYPHPIFNMPVEEAVDAEERGASIMVKCIQCIVAEETLLPMIRRCSMKSLNQTFLHLAYQMFQRYSGIMKEINDESVQASPELIRNTLMTFPDHYKTVEGFSADYRLIKFQTVRRYGKESEEVEAVNSMLVYLQKELLMAFLCWECYTRRYDSRCYGKVMPVGAYFRVLEASCTVPHPLIWVSRHPDYPAHTYWPAKLLFVDDETGAISIHCFEEQATRNFEANEVNVHFFSIEDPNNSSGRPGRKRKAATEQLIKKAMTACEKYQRNLEAKFGVDGVVIRQEIADFRGSYKRAFEKMFPKLNLESMIKARNNDEDNTSSSLEAIEME